ncbi:TPA: hypothetical protein QCQ37_001469, partial [Bacillus cereus]|nr:hypothetical protein [Bacillus cereus]
KAEDEAKKKAEEEAKKKAEDEAKKQQEQQHQNTGGDTPQADGAVVTTES